MGYRLRPAAGAHREGLLGLRASIRQIVTPSSPGWRPALKA